MKKQLLISSLLFLTVGGAAVYSLSLLNSNIEESKDRELTKEDIRKAIQEIEKPASEYVLDDINRDATTENNNPSAIQYIHPTVDKGDTSNGNKKITREYSSRPGNLTRAQGKAKVDLIREYSLKIVGTTSCTGGFLDYEIPKNGGYPKKGFIATNLHCIVDQYFGEDTYNTTLPKTGNQTPTVLRLSKETIEIPGTFKDLEFQSGRGPTFQRNYVRGVEQQFVHGDTQANSIPEDIKVHKGTYKDNRPKLVYAAINYLGNKEEAKKLGYPFERDLYYKDFAVLEVNFDTEDQARKLTGNFYNKFDPEIGYRKHERIDFFADELIVRKTPQQLVDEQEDLFVAGYPSNSGSQTFSVSNYDEEKLQASRLSNRKHSHMIRNSYDQQILGHIDSATGDFITEKSGPSTILYWNEKPLRNGGYRYFLDNIKVGGGSSGAIVMDSSNRLLGLNSAHGLTYGDIEPIRSKGVFKNGKMMSPEYDLILGTEKQKYSYKSQIEKHFLTKGITTNLSRQRKGVANPN